MGNKSVITRIAVVLVLISLVGMRLANANPIPFPATPNTDLPTLTVQTPESQSPLYSNNSLELNFTLIKPNSWNSYYNGFFPVIGECVIYLYLDGTLKQGYPWTKETVDNYNVVLSNLTSQQHTVKIDAYAITFSQIGDYQSNVTQTISFTINANSQTISFYANPVMTIRGPYPSATPISSINPSPSLSPTLTPTPSIPEFPTALTITFLIMITVAFAVQIRVKQSKEN